jgi:curved DNA-binding protein CbpA
MKLEQAYSILCVTASSSENEIKSAYKKLALKTHPDKNPSDPDASKKFREVSEAYKRITDPASFENEGDDYNDDGNFSSFNDKEMFDIFNMMMSELFTGGMSGYSNSSSSRHKSKKTNKKSTKFSSFSNHYSANEEDLDEEFIRFMNGGGGGGSNSFGGYMSAEEELLFSHIQMEDDFEMMHMNDLMSALLGDELGGRRTKGKNPAKKNVVFKKGKKTSPSTTFTKSDETLRSKSESNIKTGGCKRDEVKIKMHVDSDDEEEEEGWETESSEGGVEYLLSTMHAHNMNKEATPIKKKHEVRSTLIDPINVSEGTSKRSDGALAIGDNVTIIGLEK